MPEGNAKDCKGFLNWALPLMDMRPEGYRKVRKQVCKRINTRLKELGLGDHRQYREYLLAHPGEWEVLDQLLHISISRFFRDQDSWEELKNNLLPHLARRAGKESRTLRCWSAGCASGEEPYSLALLWRHRLGPEFPDLDIEVIATDADPHLLERAQKACYPGGNVQHVPHDWLKRSFRKQDGAYCLLNEPKRMVDFRLQDIREQMPEGPFDVVFCKNLAGMYFAQGLATEVFRRISGRLRDGGILLLGAKEPFPIEHLPDIREECPPLRIYRKADRK